MNYYEQKLMKLHQKLNHFEDVLKSIQDKKTEILIMENNVKANIKSCNNEIIDTMHLLQE